MRLTLLRQMFQSWLNLALCVLLVACGGSGGDAASDTPTGQNPPVSPPVIAPVGGSPVEMGLMVAFGYNPLVAGSPLRTNQVQNLAVGNGTANYRFPRSGETLKGNLTIAVDVADPDGIARVLVGFNGSAQALVLCDSSCGTSFSQTVTGVNPRTFGLSPGSLRLELWLEDLVGNRILFDARDIEWLPEPIVGVNTSRSAGALQVNWAANSSARRYNLYIAEQPGISLDNILTKTGGRQFLALTQTGFSVPALDDNRRYFVLITGVDSSGESLFSEQHVVQPVGAPEFSSPVALPDSFSLTEDQEFSGFLLANDSHPDDRSFSLNNQPIRAPENGTVLLNADGSFVYKSAANFSGNDSFIYQITDTQGLTAQALVSLTVLPVNDPPVALDDSYSLDKNSSLTVDAPGVLANDFDIDGDALLVNSTVAVAPVNGTVSLSPDGAFSYTPTANFTGEDSFAYQLSDEQGAVAQAKVTLRVGMANAAPVALNDSYELSEDEQLTVTAAEGILANDSDPDGDSISLVTTLLSTVENGQLLLATDGSFNYIPNQDFFGTDSFIYQISDPSGLVSSATVSFTVLPQNDPPVVQAANFSVNSGAILSVAAPGLLAYASDVDDDDLTVAVQPVVAPTKGSVNLAADGSFTYSANSQVTGSDSFVFKVLDSKGAFSTGTVVISLIQQASAPVLGDASFQLFASSPNGYSFAQLTAADTDPNDTAFYTILSGNEAGIFALSTTGLLMVADAALLAQQSGTTQSLLVQVQDSYGLIDQAVIQIQIVAVSVIAHPDSYSVIQGSTLTASPGVLANDLESSGATLIASLISAPAYGQLTLNSDGSFVYTPVATFYGSDSFTYQASNGTYSAQAVVSINVTYNPSSLQANNDAYTLDENSILTVSASNSLLQNDSFNPDQALTVSLVQAPPYGILNLNTDGTFTYQPATGSYGAFYFTYRLTQGALTSDALVELNITPVNDPPSLQNASATIYDDYVNSQHVVTMTLYDPDPGSYSFEILSGNTGGVFSITSTGDIQIANSSLLDASTTASYSLVVKVTENGDANLVDTATVFIAVIGSSATTDVLSDQAFAGGGSLSLQMMLSGEYHDPVQIIPLNDSRSLVLGNVGVVGDQEVFVARLGYDGSIDTGYGNSGLFRNAVLEDSLSEQAVAAVLTAAQELVVLVNYTDPLGTGFFLIKLDSEGNQIGSFGSPSGYLLCEYTPCNSSDVLATDLILTNAGKYLVSGVRDGNSAFLYEFVDTGYYAGTISVPSDITGFNLVRQDSDGNYYGIGESSSNQIAVARFLPDFNLDNSFGCTPTCVGYQTYDLSLSNSSTTAYDAVLHNDELYIVGSVTETLAPGSQDGLFFKVGPDGSLDENFGVNLGFTQVDGYLNAPLHYRSITLDATGFYILTSTTESGNDKVSLSHYALTGQFITDQPVVTDGQLKAIDLQSDSSGLWLLNHFSHPNYGPAASISFNWVGKYSPTTLTADILFSAKGHRWFSAGFSNDTLLGSQRLLLGAQVNKTLFYGYSQSIQNSGYKQAFIGRLTSSGNLDLSFGNHGIVLLADDALTDLDINVLIEGNPNQFYVAGVGVDTNYAQTGFVMRLTNEGMVDSTFAGGLFDLEPSAAGNYQGSEALQLQQKEDGHLLIGAEYSGNSGNVDLVLLQLNADGTLDNADFGSAASGYTVFNQMDTAASIVERFSQMKLDPVDSSIVVTGQFRPSGDNQLFVARFSSDGLLMNNTNSPLSAFGTAGQGYRVINLVDSSQAGNNYQEEIRAIDFDAERKLLLVLSRSFESGQDVYLERLLSTGLTDSTFNYGVPRIYTSLNDLSVDSLNIHDIELDLSGRLLMTGTYRQAGSSYAWVGRVLLDGSGPDVGRWDPAFQSNYASYGVHLFADTAYPSSLLIDLSGSKVRLGWSEFLGESSIVFKQYQLYETP